MNTQLIPALTRSWWVLVVYGAIAILFGLYLLMAPAAGAVGLTWAYGVVALVEGLLGLFALFGRHVAVSRGWLALYAAASILFGACALAQPLQMAGVMLLLLAAWLIIAGVFRLVFAIRVRKFVSNEWMLVLSGVLALALGLLFAAYPIAGVLTIVIWIGAAALVYGVLQVIAGFRLRSLK